MLRWTAKDAVKLDIEGIGALPAEDTGTQTVTPAATTTYVAEVTDAAGTTSRCSTSLAVVSQSADFGDWPPAYMRELPADYLGRVKASLADGLRRPNLGRDIGWVNYAVQALAVGQDGEAINRYFATQFTFPAHPKNGFGLHAIDTLRLYGLYFDASRQMPDRLSAAAQDRMLEQIWLVAARFCRNDVALALATWTLVSSENHDIALKSGCLLAAQWLARSTAFAERRYDDGSNAREQYQAWREFISLYIDERAKRGLFAEIASPTYEDEAIQAILNIRDFAEDPAIRAKAEMLLDLVHAVMAEDSLGGVRGGGKSRVYTYNPAFWGTRDRGFDLLFGTPPDVPFAPLQYPAFSTSSYYPPSIVAELARDDDGRGRYEAIARRPGILVAPEGRSGPIDPQRSVIRYEWVTPAYILGSTMLDASASYAPVSSQNRWQGLILRGGAEDRIATQLTRLTPAGAMAKEQRTHNSFFSLQHKNVLVTRKLANPGLRVDVYFPDTLDTLEEGDGWIFARKGNAFAALKVVEGGYRWLDPDNRNRAPARENRFIALEREDSPIILLADEADNHGGDFAQFKSSLVAQPLAYEAGTLEFAGLTFYPPPRLGLIGTVPVNLEPARVFDSPFIRSDFGSGYIEIRKGSQLLTLDFRDPSNPQKLAH